MRGTYTATGAPQFGLDRHAISLTHMAAGQPRRKFKIVAHRKPKKSCIVDANRVCLSHRPVNRIDTKAGNPAIHEIAEEISVIAGLQYRLASYLAEASAHPFQADTISGLVYRLASAASRSPQMRPRDRAILVTWAIMCVPCTASFSAEPRSMAFCAAVVATSHQGASRGFELAPIASTT